VVHFSARLDAGRLGRRRGGRRDPVDEFEPVDIMDSDSPVVLLFMPHAHGHQGIRPSVTYSRSLARRAAMLLCRAIR